MKAEKAQPTAVLQSAGILNRTQLALELGVLDETVAAWEAEGLPVIPMGRKTRLYDVQEIIEWLKRRRNKKKI